MGHRGQQASLWCVNAIGTKNGETTETETNIIVLIQIWKST
jgi:hypothetical protein